MDSLVARAKKLFAERFGGDALIGVAAPGRVNLIGEHTDYQGGFVMPMALEKSTVIVGCATHASGARCQIVSANAPAGDGGAAGVCAFSADATLAPDGPGPKWARYVKGVVAQYVAAGGGSFSFDAAIVSDVPLGGGLSSSASLEVATAAFLEALLRARGARAQVPSPVERAARCVEAEHAYAHVPCGIMDQFASSLCRAGHALLLDCASRAPTHIPLAPPAGGEGGGLAVVVINSNVSHELTGSEYPDRVRQCQEAVAGVNAAAAAAARARGQAGPARPHAFLRTVTLAELEARI